MKKIFFWAMFVVSGAAAAPPANEPRPLFHTVDLSKFGLAPSQEKILGRVKESPLTVKWVVVRLDENAWADPTARLLLPLPGRQPVVVAKSALSRDGRNVTGRVSADGAAYVVEPLGKGLHVIAHIKEK